MNWNKITVGQYQQIYPILLEDKWTRLDKLTKVISIVTGKSEEEVDSMPLNALKEYDDIFNMPEVGKPISYIKVNGRHYRLCWDIQKLPAARYIEGKTFSQEGIINNLHMIMASCVMPSRKILWFYRDMKYDAAKHSEYANDMKDVPFVFAYNACVFFLQSIRELDKLFPILFGAGVERSDDQGPGDNIEEVFQRHYGWTYSAVLVAEHERITLDQAYELPVLQFINDLAYLKMKGKMEKAQMEELRKRK